MLGLQTKPGVPWVRNSVLASYGAVQKIAAVELNGGLRSPHFHNSPSVWIMQFGSLLEVLRFVIQDKIVVVAMPLVKLFLVLVNSVTGRRQLAKIKRCARNRAEFSGRNKGRVHGSKS